MRTASYGTKPYAAESRPAAISEVDYMEHPLHWGYAYRGWARDAHFRALAKLPQFTLTAVSARTQTLAEEARAAHGAPRAYGDSMAPVRASDVASLPGQVRQQTSIDHRVPMFD
jgi:hypothetical protein